MLESQALFGLAALCDIGGGYLVWRWRQEGQTRAGARQAIVSCQAFTMPSAPASVSSGSRS
jgi:drug/metabolite transporter superfamily protein YnfA